jgi:hypothetical protein
MDFAILSHKITALLFHSYDRQQAWFSFYVIIVETLVILSLEFA